MIDTKNPNEQFHSYQSPEFTSSTNSNMGSSVNSPSSSWSGGLSNVLNRFGLNNGSMSSMRNSMNNMNMGESVNKARTYAAANPGKVLGGLAALVIGAGMMRGRTR